MVSDERKPDGTGLVTMADPEGNQFGPVVHASRDTVALDLAPRWSSTLPTTVGRRRMLPGRLTDRTDVTGPRRGAFPELRRPR